MIIKDIENTKPGFLRGMATYAIGSVINEQQTRTIEDKDYETFCCYRNYVFAESSITETRKNDKYSVGPFRRILKTDTITFTLQRNPTGRPEIPGHRGRREDGHRRHRHAKAYGKCPTGGSSGSRESHPHPQTVQAGRPRTKTR